jgi:hypothetical protein
MSLILHDWDDEPSLRILRNIAKAAAPGTRLVIIETVLPTDDSPHFSKLTDLIMLVMNSGRERTVAEYDSLLDAAGFTLDRAIPSHTPYSFIEATLR